MLGPPGESRVLDCVREFLSHVREADCRVVALPDDDAGLQSQQSVEMVVQVGHELVSIEHTRMQAFAGQLQADRHFLEFIEPIQASLDEWFTGPGHFDITWDVGADRGHRPRERQRYQEAIECWVKAHAGLLRAADVGRWDSKSRLRAEPPGVPFEVTVTRHHGLDGGVYFGRFAPPDDELRSARRADVVRALERKLPKVVQDARARGGRSMLALEISDMAFGGLASVFRIASRLLGPGTDLDWLIVVDTIIETRDYLMALEIEGPAAGTYKRTPQGITVVRCWRHDWGEPGGA